MAVRFCDLCCNLMTKTTTFNGINFKCICGETKNGTPADTLMYEWNSNIVGNDTYHSNITYDVARHLVPKKCEKCGMLYQVLTVIGSSMVPRLLCECGSNVEHD
jgi:DNA-directed RNA polymerase subunit M/transcription elongation factor TFIIS